MKSIIKMLFAVVCLSLCSSAVSAADGVKLEIRLTPTAAAAGAAGKATYEVRSDRRKLSVQGEKLVRFNGQRATILVNGVSAGTAAINLGRFDLNLDSRLGQRVPAVAAGTTVQVNVGTTSVLSGRF